MNTYKIAVCGAPQVGKRTLLDKLGQLIGFRVVGTFNRTKPNMFVAGQYQSNTLLFATGSGSYLYPESMIQALLPQASAVIYVLSPAYSSNGRLNFSDETYRHYLDLYLYHAQRFNVGWDQIPWLLVLNKTDLAEYLPIEAALFPDTVRQNYVRCTATKGVGIAEVWQKLLELLDLPASDTLPNTSS